MDHNETDTTAPVAAAPAPSPLPPPVPPSAPPPAPPLAPRGLIDRYAGPIALAALVVALLGQDWLLGAVGIRTQTARRVSEVTQQAGRLEQRSVELEKQLAAASAQLAKQQAQAVEANARIEASQNWVRTMALVQFGAALRRPGPFDLELAMVKTSAAAPPELVPLLAKIEPYAATGVPGIAQLQRDFIALRSRIDGGDRFIPLTWMNKVISWPRGAATTQTAEATPPDPTSRQFGDAAIALAKENLAGAVAIAQQITGMGRELISDWVEDAEARVALDEAGRRVNDLVVQRLGTPADKPVR